MFLKFRMFAVAAALALAACSTIALLPFPPWQATEAQDHPLTGKIWRAADGAFITTAELARALDGADLVLLGETHDNPDHHRIQAWAVDHLFAGGRKPGLAIEMIREDQQAALDKYLAAHPRIGDGIGAALDWDNSGWPAWEHYRPVIAPFAANGAPIRAANLPRTTIRALVRDGYPALGTRRLPALALDAPLGAGIVDEIAAEMMTAHCGQISTQRARPFARIQIARDAVMAAALQAAAKPSGKAVLVAGSGHVRKDRGVPWHLARQGGRRDSHHAGPGGGNRRAHPAHGLWRALWREDAAVRLPVVHTAPEARRPMRGNIKKLNGF